MRNKYLAAVCALTFSVAMFSACGSDESIAVSNHSSQSLSSATLGTAQNYAVLGASTVTNTGSTVLTGDLGVNPGLAITGFPPGIDIGSTHVADANALQAQSDTTIAFNALSAEACTTDLTGQDLGGLTLTPGTYCFDSSAGLTGALTLDGAGNADAIFVFKMQSTLTTASNSLVQMINSGNECNVFWQVGSSATLGTGTVFVGNILALTSITLTTNAKVSGRALARNGAVTLDTNTVSIANCSQSADAGGTGDTGSNDSGQVDSSVVDSGRDSGQVDSGGQKDASVPPPVDAGVDCAIVPPAPSGSYSPSPSSSYSASPPPSSIPSSIPSSYP